MADKFIVSAAYEDEFDSEDAALDQAKLLANEYLTEDGETVAYMVAKVVARFSGKRAHKNTFKTQYV